MKLPGWPPKIQEFIEEMESKIVIPAPFSPKLEARRRGNLYEIRTYTMLPGAAPTVIERWAERIEGRLKYSPLAFCGHTERGGILGGPGVGPLVEPTRRPPSASGSVTRHAPA